MSQPAYEQVVSLTEKLNRYRHEYYNLNAPSVSDQEYDALFDELARLEDVTGIQMSNSPTRTVGYPAVSELEKTTHSIPLLSLAKEKSSAALLDFMGDQLVLLMLKLDGLTMKLTYENGELIQAATRGDGNEGEVVTHNARGIKGIPLKIPYQEHLVVVGEAFIRPSDFERLKGKLLDSTGKPYKNGRNLAAGSVRLLDAKVCKERCVTFMPFNVLEGLEAMSLKSDRLLQLWSYGFTVCPYFKTTAALNQHYIDMAIERLQELAKKNDIPIDGIVVTYNDIAYSKSCGRTGHHYKDGIAYKFEDDTYMSKLQYIEWNPTRSGEIAPVAVFDPVEIDGCEVSRASLHNLSFIEGLELMPGNRIKVSKRNMIIPHVEDNLDRGSFSLEAVIPQQCPCCGEPTRIHESKSTVDGRERVTKTLFCDNPNCETRRLRQFVHFVGDKAMDIAGLSEATLEKFIGRGWIHSYMDIYRLDRHKPKLSRWTASEKNRGSVSGIPSSAAVKPPLSGIWLQWISQWLAIPPAAPWPAPSRAVLTLLRRLWSADTTSRSSLIWATHCKAISAPGLKARTTGLSGMNCVSWCRLHRLLAPGNHRQSFRWTHYCGDRQG